MTQRGESINNYFKGFFTPSTPINEFVTQYEETIKKRQNKEAKADVTCITSTPSCSTGHKIEYQASNVYTKKVFKVFSVEWFACFGLEASQCDDEITVKRYKVCSRDGDREIHVNYVLDNQEDEITIYDCKMFEQKGMLCKHILKIHVIMDKSQIPHRYIMLRWTKGARYIESGLGEGSSERQPQQLMWILHDIAHQLASEGSLSQERYNVAHGVLSDGLQEVLRLQATVSNLTGNFVLQGGQCISDPLQPSINRGRQRTSRFRSKLERRVYHCSFCNSTRHNVTRCPMVNVLTGDTNRQQLCPPMQLYLNEPPSIE
ncbi:protein FAR1-RELATED SEQUENCE 12-like [Telopea speciosissima]|uniref:protein FAR1-RELATED SEQUENCE 12-like n=1 Tax=Telopea speciosissima TaxID=54955 RepID=UPI001CC6EB5E|nr:protein FAR1-RELATED SEQUENCE 12-like [Telopea speciosissima]